jgi:2-oxoglutarate ferredoxin oxidoreductase subunit alpha
MSLDLFITIGGKAGDGSFLIGDILAKTFRLIGYNVLTYRDFPSNIRGLPTYYSVRVSDKPIYAVKDFIDYLVAFEFEAVEYLKRYCSSSTVIIYDNSIRDIKDIGIKSYGIPFKKMSINNLGSELFKNTIALGALTYILGVDEKHVLNVLMEAFMRRSGEIMDKNVKAYKIGREYAIENIKIREEVGGAIGREGFLLSGNEAIAIGAIIAGCRFYAGYPITPATEIMELLIMHMPKYQGVAIQVEDEIAAINMAIGASYAGLRAMTATSGPGFSLMAESLSLAGMTELPIVIVYVQRAGPSTGIATKMEQSDTLQALFSGHGEFPRIVLTPGTVEEAFYMTTEAFNLAEKIQCPVIILIDQFIAQNRETVNTIDLSRIRIDRGKLIISEVIGDYRRYEITDDGISPRTIPLVKGGIYLANSNEHDERGYTAENPWIRESMVNKRLKKLEVAKKILEEKFPHKIYGFKNAKIAFIGYGSVHGVVLEVVERLNVKEPKAKYLQLRYLWPFPLENVNKFIHDVDRIYVVEHNAQGQLSELVRWATGVRANKILKYDGRAFRPVDIMKAVGSG